MTRRFTVRDWIIVLVFLAITGYFYAGFWFPDEYAHGWSFVFVLHAIRVLLPICALVLVWLYWRVRTGRTAFANIAVLATSLALGALLLYPLLTEIFYKGRFLHRSKRLYHPYLQITPQDFTYRQTSDTTGSKPFRIFCLGGSTTEYADSNGKDWPSGVEQNVQGVLGDRPVEIYNCGREWYTSLHQLINYQFNLRQYKPDMLILLHGINDLWINCDFNSLCTGPFRQDYGHYDGPISRLVNRRSIYGATNHVFQSFWYFSERQTLEVDSFPGLESYERYLRTCIELARNDGTRVVLMTQPHIFHENMVVDTLPKLFMYDFNAHNDTVTWSLESAHRGIIQYNQKVRDIAELEGCFLIDLENLIPETEEFFIDDVHYTMAGYNLMRTVISSELRAILSDESFAAASSALRK